MNMIQQHTNSKSKPGLCPFTTRNCIYAICLIGLAGFVYVGQTYQSLDARFEQHWNSAINKTDTTRFHDCMRKYKDKRRNWIVIPLELVLGNFKDDKEFKLVATPLEKK